MGNLIRFLGVKDHLYIDNFKICIFTWAISDEFLVHISCKVSRISKLTTVRWRSGHKEYTCSQRKLDLFSLLWLRRIHPRGTVGNSFELCLSEGKSVIGYPDEFYLEAGWLKRVATPVSWMLHYFCACKSNLDLDIVLEWPCTYGINIVYGGNYVA